ncbi:MAG: phosphoribosylformylglycinamidine synthase [Vicingaceae bacterium]
MIVFFESLKKVTAVQTKVALNQENIEKLEWALNAKYISDNEISGAFIGPKKEMISPWSTNAVEITQNMGIEGIVRMEEFTKAASLNATYDKMLQQMYNGLNQELFTINIQPEPVFYIDDIKAYNEKEGLALSEEEITYLASLSKKLGRKLTDSEVFGFSQVNSEHCRHKIFNGTFVIDGEEKPLSLFKLIKKSSEQNPNIIVSAYKDNVSFVKGPKILQFAPKSADKADFFEIKPIDAVLSLKAETHNFPTTVEPFNGAATGSGGEIRDRMAGGKGSVPMAGTAVYMTSYPRINEERKWENDFEERDWLYQTPLEILIKASNGASDFGNKFGQPLINGSLLTFEQKTSDKLYGYDKVIMLAGGIGYAKLQDAQKETPQKGDKIVILGGDNYRIGMGGSAVSSVATGEYSNAIELNAIQRSNPEMQKRVANVIRAFSEATNNPIVSIHDHGAGGHLNCLSELVEATGGVIYLRKLPIGDPTMSAKEIIGNESQERMGLVIGEKHIELLSKICERERAPMYVVGDITADHQFKFIDEETNENPIDLRVEDLFGNPPKTIINDEKISIERPELTFDAEKFETYLQQVLQIEAVACKDWLTNKVDRSVTGKVAVQQNVGELQLPLNNLGVVALDYDGINGIATALGHAPVAALIDAKKGSRLAIAEALTNIVWAPLTDGLKSVSLSANWMWPCKNKGEDARLYEAVEAVSDFACDLGINIPTGKDSLSMTQKYNDKTVYAPGTVIITASAPVENIRTVVEPALQNVNGSKLYYVDFSGNQSFELGGTSFAQVNNQIGNQSSDVSNAAYFKKAFDFIQSLIKQHKILAGHDVSAGGLITTLLEMTFPNKCVGLNINLTNFNENNFIKVLFSEKPAVVIQVSDESIIEEAKANGINILPIGEVINEEKVIVQNTNIQLDIEFYRKLWFKTSYLLDKNQTNGDLALKRYQNFDRFPLKFKFPNHFNGKIETYQLPDKIRLSTGIKAAIIREKGVNGDREMAYSLYLAGFDVKDVHMTDLMTGKEDLTDVHMIVFVGGFSNSDVLGSAKGWAGAFKYNQKANESLKKFYAREDTLSLGVCNGCQLMIELGLIKCNGTYQPMAHNDSGKFESAFLNVSVQPSSSIMFKSLEGMEMGIWVAHGEGKFVLNDEQSKYNIALTYKSDEYPVNPNGSAYNAAGIVSNCGRHLAMMPHLERVIFPWQAGYYPNDRKKDAVTPWFEAFVNARKWIKEKIKA